MSKMPTIAMTFCYNDYTSPRVGKDLISMNRDLSTRFYEQRNPDAIIKRLEFFREKGYVVEKVSDADGLIDITDEDDWENYVNGINIWMNRNQAITYYLCPHHGEQKLQYEMKRAVKVAAKRVLGTSYYRAKALACGRYKIDPSAVQVPIQYRTDASKCAYKFWSGVTIECILDQDHLRLVAATSQNKTKCAECQFEKAEDLNVMMTRLMDEIEEWLDSTSD